MACGGAIGAVAVVSLGIWELTEGGPVPELVYIAIAAASILVLAILYVVRPDRL